jgi:hypothetical protein
MKQSKFYVLLREPLLHFLVIGAGIFFLFNHLNLSNVEKAAFDNRKIIITQADLDSLATSWLKAKGRPASEEERERQLKYHIREQVLYREAMIMGLDKNDVIVRRRLAKKMNYLFDDLTVVSEPNEQELEKFISEHASLFTRLAEVSFSQVFLEPAEHGRDINKDAEKLLGELQQKPTSFDAINLGDRSLLPYDFTGERKNEIAGMFGGHFAKLIFTSDIGSWQGPMISGYGVHLVNIHSRTTDVLPPLAEIHKQVLKEWISIKRREANEVFYQSMAERYEIILDDAIVEKTKKNDSEINE